MGRWNEGWKEEEWREGEMERRGRWKVEMGVEGGR